MAVTQEQIDDTIKNCPYKMRLYDIDVCRVDVYPCERVIDSGQCDTLIKLFRGGSVDGIGKC